MIPRTLIYTFILGLVPISLLGQRSVAWDDRVVEMQNLAEIFIDSSGSKEIQEIQKIYNDGKFCFPPENAPKIARASGTIWFRFVIKNQLAQSLYLRFPEILLDDIEVYTQNFSGEWRTVTTGYQHPFYTRALPFNDYSIELKDLARNQNTVVFGALRTSSKNPVFVRMSVGTGRAISSESRKSELISMSVIGILLIMLFYNFCLSIVISESLFLSYCVYIIAAALMVLEQSGFAFEWFWPESPAMNRIEWALGPYYLAQVWFVNKLLQIKEHLVKLYRASFLLHVLCLLLIFREVLPPGFTNDLHVIVGVVSPGYFLICSIILAARKERIAYIFLIGWLPLIIITVLNMLMAASMLPYHFIFDRHALEIALAWELVIFSLVIGYRFNRLRTEKMEMQSENFRMLSEQKTLLRKMVFEQTEEIMAQNDQLLRNQEEIKKQNDQLEKQNKAYERLKELILKQNQELESAVQKRTVQLAHSNEELKKHLHQVEQFSFISAHNLRAPVARILGLASIFDRSKVIGKENLAILDRLVSCAKDLDIIIHDLGAILDTQKNTSDKSEVIDVTELLDKILNRYEAEVSSEGINISINAEAKYVHAVPAYLDSILSNLISNSIKYRAEHKPSFIQITTEEVPSGWKIGVEDNGLGFDSKLFSRKIFEPFQRFHTHKEGKGLGMFLVKTQVTAMEGMIELHSEPNKGTHVSIMIPKRKFQKTA